MFVSLDIPKLAAVAAAVGAFAALVPVAQAEPGFDGSPDAVDRAVAARQAQLGSGFKGSPDAIDRAVAARQTQLISSYDAREHAQLAVVPPPDVVDRAVFAHQLDSATDLSRMPDVLERTAAAGALQYGPVTSTSSRFDWSDFGIGAGAGMGLLLVLGLGIGAIVVRHNNGRAKTA